MTTLNPGIQDPISLLLQSLAEAYRCSMAASNTENPANDAWSDESLVEAILKRGSQQHFRTLLARYKTKVHHLSLSVLGPAQQAHAEDVSQEVFIKLYQRLESFRGDCKFSTWLYRIAINTAIDFKRRHSRHDLDDINELSLPESLVTAPISLEDRDSAIRIQHAIRALPETQRMMIYQHYWLGLKMREIAEILGCPEGTVKAYLFRARKSLAGQLGGLENA